VIGIELMMACAPAVAPETIQHIIQVESRGNHLAINVNKGRLERKPTDAADAAALAKSYIEQGYTVDLGLMQINSTNVIRLGYRVEDMFEPCKNIAAGARILTEFYALARHENDNEQTALRAALSAYNTGNFINGFTNGYVARYGISGPVSLVRIPAINPYTADTTVFINSRKGNIMNDTKETVTPVVSRLVEDAETPGVQVEYTADVAEQNGAFEETAISEKEAWEANIDLAEDPENTSIVIGRRKVNRGGDEP